jgi:predicted  nucleic acid-binding Zn-ribbon protein
VALSFDTKQLLSDTEFRPAIDGQEKAMPTKETLNTRVTRLETVIVVLAEAQVKTEEHLQRIAKQFGRTDKRMAQTDKRMAQTDKRMAQLRKESNEREKRLDERIGKLVSAIGKLITRMPPPIEP